MFADPFFLEFDMGFGKTLSEAISDAESTMKDGSINEVIHSG